jgi:hypothetical protein
MKIGLYNLEQSIPNTAMMQVSQFHKLQGDHVEIYSPILKDHYDKVYAFSLFNYTEKHYVTKDMICGGTGFDIKSVLPKDIEACDLDYSLFPECRQSFIWFSRGCIRQCPYCVVWQKEGAMKQVTHKNLNPRGNTISVMDNNFFANPQWRQAIKILQTWNQRVEFCSGLDIRIFNEEQGEALQSLKLSKFIHIAWDNSREDLRDKIKFFLNYVPAHKVVCYVLIGYWSNHEENMYRIQELDKMKVIPFVMPFNKKDHYQKNFARWVNNRAIFKTTPWENYKMQYSRKKGSPLTNGVKDDSKQRVV